MPSREFDLWYASSFTRAECVTDGTDGITDGPGYFWTPFNVRFREPTVNMPLVFASVENIFETGRATYITCNIYVCGVI